MPANYRVIDPETDLDVLKGLASALRVRILKLLHSEGAMNVNDIAARLDLPQSTVSSNVALLEEGQLIRTETRKARKGSQKICIATVDEVLVSFKAARETLPANAIEVAMPLGLYTSFELSAPCGLCTTEGIVGLLDVPDSFLDPDRMRAGLLWFTRGHVEYQFPNNARLRGKRLDAVEFVMELSSEVPGTREDWPSDITLSVNDTEVGTWTSPGDFGDKRGVYTPDWWKLKGSQYGMLKSWRINGDGTYVDGTRISPVTLAQLGLEEHHSIRMRVAVNAGARHPGGVNIFGKGFGNYDQDIVMRLHLAD
ncbi:ArsR/SmtB family transcription factor [Wenxinia saemankumensis]|uniref:Predicted transcriptional regulator n=1 Tax=Wenxinia saemankumensis TaxID=1447782 RepID=A0A1M6FLE5_9RHOB|nr:helix-turn-helix domain-containing protein [Wenxinia saemankumensis]SHI98463.1 Predicted transcriptional regulator [Wenxinia saemankumensis]